MVLVWPMSRQSPCAAGRRQFLLEVLGVFVLVLPISQASPRTIVVPDPTFGGVPPPTKVTHTVGERIALDSERIGLIAQRLLEVQNNIDSVEQEVVGKVFDVDSLKNFLGAHQEAAAEGERLQASMSSTSATVGALAKQLAEERANLVKQEVEHRRRMAQMKADLARFDGEILLLKRRLVEQAEYELKNRSLTEATLVLRNHSRAEIVRIDSDDGELAAAKAELEKKTVSVMELDGEVRRQNSFSTVCQLKAERLRLDLEVEERRISVSVSKDSQREAEGMEAEQALLSENKGFKARLLKAKQNLRTFQDILRSTNGRYAALQQEGQTELVKLRKVLGVERQKADSKVSELNSQMHERASMEKEVLQTEASVDSLKSDVFSGRFAQLRSSITQLKRDLNFTFSAMKKSDEKEADAWRTIARANETILILRNSTEQSAEQARQITQMSLSQIAKIKQFDDAIAKEAETAAMEAEASMMIDCEFKWKEENKVVTQELDACRQVKQELNEAKVEVKFLSNSLPSLNQKNNRLKMELLNQSDGEEDEEEEQINNDKFFFPKTAKDQQFLLDSKMPAAPAQETLDDGADQFGDDYSSPMILEPTGTRFL
eukprot:TRINITY_DN49712_c0_g1_i1.p1 TRINITY_DN49712_c0_g1~~TRINITY_DN49712_c0_g1_i1.p1  ORF type:complete len:604 (+),score=137.86 TRINITY_DN49712_c0_g1_i1:156-1967(+)